jgi:hypothetical protein
MKKMIEKIFLEKISIWSIVCLMLLPFACKINDDDKKVTLSTYVYIAGQTQAPYRKPCIWKNGVRSELGFPEERNGYALSVFVSDSHVYVAGYNEFALKSWGEAMYWKDGARNDLAVLSDDMGGVANGICVMGGDIYISGYRVAFYYTDRNGNKQLNCRPCFWKNGILSTLPVPNEAIGGIASSIFVCENDVFVSGNASDTVGNLIPCFWKNGQRHDLEIPGMGDHGTANSIFVSRSEVYTAGTLILNSIQYDPSHWIPSLWINGKWTELSRIDPANLGQARGVFLDGMDIYVSGKTREASDVPCFWKNGVRIDLPAAAKNHVTSGDAGGLCVFGGDVYVAGSMSYMPCYWKNGAQISLSVPDAAWGGEATGIFVINQ